MLFHLQGELKSSNICPAADVLSQQVSLLFSSLIVSLLPPQTGIEGGLRSFGLANSFDCCPAETAQESCISSYSCTDGSRRHAFKSKYQPSFQEGLTRTSWSLRTGNSQGI